MADKNNQHETQELSRRGGRWILPFSHSITCGIVLKISQESIRVYTAFLASFLVSPLRCAMERHTASMQATGEPWTVFGRQSKKKQTSSLSTLAIQSRTHLLKRKLLPREIRVVCCPRHIENHGSDLTQAPQEEAYTGVVAMLRTWRGYPQESSRFTSFEQGARTRALPPRGEGKGGARGEKQRTA